MRKNIKILVMDVDGTLTDGRVYIGEAGEIMKVFHIKDGYAIRELLPKYNICPIIITGRNSKIVSNRCQELLITEIYQGVTNKVELMDKILMNKNLRYENVAFIGDDLNDYECMEKAALAGCPCDAVGEVQKIADFISTVEGGAGAVREFINWIIKEHIEVCKTV